MLTIKLKVIYEPSGRAKEYSNYALNIYNGCDFKCKYCFAPNVLKRDRNDFHTNVKQRDNFLKNVESDCIQLYRLQDKVLLCFTTDPYNSLDDSLMLTRKVLELFRGYKINFQILTKAGRKAERDFDLYKPGDAFATTLTFIHHEKSKLWEPNAAIGIDRIITLENAKKSGIETWVSLEPVIEPEETLKIIDITQDITDFYKVGTLNYCKSSIDWADFAVRVTSLLDKYNKKYYIKNDLKKYL